MKKSLVLAMAMALGVTASAYAANPFSDVPAGHWAYDSIDKLAAAGVIDGMGDGTYQGDKTMTRYEMAQIVAKAMAKGANVDKLAAEFADELDNLGVRVANLEKKADNVKISGTIKMRNFNYHGNAKESDNGVKTYGVKSHWYVLRSDININGRINEDWQYNATLRNEQQLAGNKKGAGEEDVYMKAANVAGRIGGVKVLAGRYAHWLESGDVFDDFSDGIQVKYGKKIQLEGGWGQYKQSAATGDRQYKYARVDGKVGVVGAHAAYYQFNDLKNIDNQDSKIAAVGINMPLAKALNMDATYYRTNKFTIGGEKGDRDGFSVGLGYKGAKATQVGSWGLTAKYYDLPASVGFKHTMEGLHPLASDGEIDGWKGVRLTGNYTLAKNIVAMVGYYGIEGNKTSKHYDSLYTELKFMF